MCGASELVQRAGHCMPAAAAATATRSSASMVRMGAHPRPPGPGPSSHVHAAGAHLPGSPTTQPRHGIALGVAVPARIGVVVVVRLRVAVPAEAGGCGGMPDRGLS